MRFIGIAFTLVFMFVGSFVGISWNDLTTAVRPSLQILRDNWRTSDIYLSTHPLETGLIFAVASAAIVPLLVAGRRLFFAIFRRKSIMDLMFRNDAEVHYIASHMRLSKKSGAPKSYNCRRMLPYSDPVSRSARRRYMVSSPNAIISERKYYCISITTIGARNLIVLSRSAVRL